MLPCLLCATHVHSLHIGSPRRTQLSSAPGRRPCHSSSALSAHPCSLHGLRHWQHRASEYWSGVHGCDALAVAVAHQGGVWAQLPWEFGPGAGHLLVNGCVASPIGKRFGPPAASAGVCVASGQGVRPPYRHKKTICQHPLNHHAAAVTSPRDASPCAGPNCHPTTQPTLTHRANRGSPC